MPAPWPCENSSPATCAGIALLVFLVCLAAASLPARRAASAGMPIATSRKKHAGNQYSPSPAGVRMEIWIRSCWI